MVKNNGASEFSTKRLIKKKEKVFRKYGWGGWPVGLSASPPPALPALFLVFEEGGKISKKIQKRGLDLFKRAGQGWPIGSPRGVGVG